jgi:hypothetical protein
MEKKFVEGQKGDDITPFDGKYPTARADHLFEVATRNFPGGGQP